MCTRKILELIVDVLHVFNLQNNRQAFCIVFLFDISRCNVLFYIFANVFPYFWFL